MEERKTFFASLEPKSALLVGLVGGVLVLCTIGFFVMLGVSLSNRSNVAKASSNNKPVVTNDGIVAPTPVVTKSDRPIVELFVMSYCPYGLQMEKAYLPAWELLKNKADISVKYVYYTMHGKKEIDENTRQYCIAKDSPEKLISYLKCFVGEDNSVKCLSAVGLTDAKLASCVSVADKQYKITASFDDQTSWLSGRYPLYNVNADLNEKYGVQGSPTLVINGAEANVGRTPEAVKQAICAAFNNPPAECSKTLSNSGYSSGFGLTASDNAANVDCGA
jgi:hypothetical protein